MADIARHLTPDDLGRALRRDVAAGLAAEPKELPPKWFYDERGSVLFDEITRLPEYYPTRAEAGILRERAAEIMAAAGNRVLVELGAGSGEKTRLLLDALTAAGPGARYLPVDVSGDFLADAAARIAADYPGLEVSGHAADFETQLDVLPPGAQTVAILGSTIGNLPPQPRIAFLSRLRRLITPGSGGRGALLLGADLVKDPARLVAAYDDARGVTAEFNRNVLRVVNRELEADFEPDRFDHVAVWDAEREWIEMRLRARGAQRVRVKDLDLEAAFADGEEMRTEISAKFRRTTLSADLAAAGLALTHWWTDPDGDFALLLARPAVE
ncbi:L-histidine N(alpha)-methyltransferase [Nocardiopsis coralliicola]